MDLKWNVLGMGFLNSLIGFALTAVFFIVLALAGLDIRFIPDNEAMWIVLFAWFFWTGIATCINTRQNKIHPFWEK